MADIYIYLDETGSCDYSQASGPRFAVGSATYTGDHRDAVWDGLQMRCEMERRGINLPQGFHAVNDSNRTRHQVFELIKKHPPRFDSTFLTKAKAYPSVQARGKPYLYQMAMYQHLKHVVPLVSGPGDDVFVIAGTIHLIKSGVKAAREAIQSVCSQLSYDRDVTGCLWEARSSWGIQVADYCCWALQRSMDQKTCTWYDTVVEDLLHSNYGPWD